MDPPLPPPPFLAAAYGTSARPAPRAGSPDPASAPAAWRAANTRLAAAEWTPTMTPPSPGGATASSVSVEVEQLVRQYTTAFNLYHLNLLDEALAAYDARGRRQRMRTRALY